MIGEYRVMTIIGSGTTCKVVLAEHSETHQQVAIKIIRKVIFEKMPRLRDKIQREIALMRLFDHPHLLKLLEVCESARHLYVVLEYASKGELFDYLVKQKRLPFDVAMKFFRQLIYGLEYLHSHAICHRDLKPENILLGSNYDLKIADFGFARWMKSNVTDTSCGSPHYAAPEVIKAVPYDGRCADIWSCGVILYALLCGSLPFNDPSIRNLLAKVKAGQYIMPPVPPDLQDLVSKMLIVDPNQRIKIEDIKAHRAFRWELPEQYVLPTPLPSPVKSDPIDPSTIDPDIMNALHQIGYIDDAELYKDLVAQGHTMAKVFYRMLTADMSLDALPWFSQQENVYTATDAYMLMPLSSNGSGSLELPNGFSYGTSYSEQVSLPSVPSQLLTYDIVQPFIGIRLPWEVLMTNMQGFLTAQDFQWFHPDDYTLISRRAEDLMYLIVKLEHGEEETVNMRICFWHASQEAIQMILEILAAEIG